MEKFMISKCFLDKLDDAISAYGAIGLINEFIKEQEERASFIMAIQNGVYNTERDENEDPRRVLEQLRECYSADTEVEANDRACRLRTLCELIEAADDAVNEYRFAIANKPRSYVDELAAARREYIDAAEKYNKLEQERNDKVEKAIARLEAEAAGKDTTQECE